eukprot:3120486-Amphidinium_carterae.1
MKSSAGISAFTLTTHCYEEQQLEGEFRHRHSQLIAQCEPIAFLGGEEPERKVLNGHLDKLMSHCWDTTRLSLNYEVIVDQTNYPLLSQTNTFWHSSPSSQNDPLLASVLKNNVHNSENSGDARVDPLVLIGVLRSVVRQYLNKYFVTVIGLYLVSRPLRINKLQSNTQ